MNLETLLKIARAATPGPWVKGIVSGQCHMDHYPHGRGECVYEYTIRKGNGIIVPRGTLQPITLISAYDDYNNVLNDADADYIATFNPRLIEKLLAEVLAARVYRDSDGNHLTENKHWDDANMYDKAREALDAELSPKE